MRVIRPQRLHIWILCALAVLPYRALAADPVPFVVASDTINQDMQQDADASPSYNAPDLAAAAAAQDPAFAARRERMIKECKDNNGVDCATQVDTELGAELLQQGGVQHIAPPRARPR